MLSKIHFILRLNRSFPMPRFFIVWFSLLSLIACLANPAHAQQPPMPGQAPGDSPMEMNGITSRQFGDFVHNWHYVTVRFRRDKGEQRFVYANDSAWKALLEHSTDYPDGAVFAKVAVQTQEDPVFINSQIPTNQQRVQYMVRDHDRYKDTDGWGYALFNPDGSVALGEPQKMALQACNACHQVVRDKGLILRNRCPRCSARLPVSHNRLQRASAVSFSTVDVAILPEYVRKQIPAQAKKIGRMPGSMPQHVFYGTTAEAVPLIAAEAVRANMPAVLISQDGTPQFSLVWPAPLTDKNAKPCDLPGGKKGTMVFNGRTVTLPGNLIDRRYQYRIFDPYCSPVGPDSPHL